MKNIFAYSLLLSLSTLAQADNSNFLTAELAGEVITYEYSEGHTYSLKFTAEKLSYRNHDKHIEWQGSYPYQATRTDYGQYLIAWYEQDNNDFVTVLIDPTKNIIHGSALFGGEHTFFHKGKLINK
ncbi:MoaF N-terminal domain-containing protein [Ferrimonas lipolytica]|uniref:Molybdenum cofactor biosynthesis protein F N-terminal domain-containing protein n=1 Tax=Ferrimonas lipolytica TaxID=2724191 RepID=A0A6H1UBD3_9GAMM|nr:MoaF N-terminal domain-containing protein [Ferrimonas lipolytica]QIZ76148.1 hypothetical protein HER31_04120 [Ferrimonas lipolytica]